MTAIATRLNTLTDLIEGTFAQGNNLNQTIAYPFTLGNGNAYTPCTLNRILLSYSYMSQGLVQTVIRQPVDDAFRGGINIKTNELSEDEIKSLLLDFKRSRKPNRKLSRKLNPNAAVNEGYSDMRVAKDVLCWSRLFGGSGLIVNTAQDFRTPLNVEAINEDTPLEFIAADRWELILSQMNIFDTRNPCPFNFYGAPLHYSRVIKVLGAEAPSFIRLRLQGWGFSEIERCVRAINSFVKFENVIFELLDEAKIDVYKIQGFNDSLLTDDGTANTQKRIALSNRLKNYQNALAMDVEDDYTQKQLSFGGLAEIWNELRLNLSSALKIPMNKLFGQSATGFGGGEDALENYNAIVEQIREDANPVISEILDLRCQQKFGFIPEYELIWQPLKILDGVQQETVMASKQTRILEQFRERLLTGVEASKVLKAEGLLHMDTEVFKGLRDVEPMQMMEMQQNADAPNTQPDGKKSDK
jgi:phage-related protein (TIGR01555 family)